MQVWDILTKLCGWEWKPGDAELALAELPASKLCICPVALIPSKPSCSCRASVFCSGLAAVPSAIDSNQCRSPINPRTSKSPELILEWNSILFCLFSSLLIILSFKPFGRVVLPCLPLPQIAGGSAQIPAPK